MSEKEFRIGVQDVTTCSLYFILLDVSVQEGMKKLTCLMIVVSVIPAFLPVSWEKGVFPTVRIASHPADVIFKPERRNGALKMH